MGDVSYLKINERSNAERPILREQLKYKIKNYLRDLENLLILKFNN